MRVDRCIRCAHFPCGDVRHECFVVPGIAVRPAEVSIVMISEAAPWRSEDGFYASADALFARTTLQAFVDAGAPAASIAELLDRGIYFTTAVKCAKTAYGIQTATVHACSELLESELALFPKLRALLLMGDVAIKSLNAIARRAGERRVIPVGSTYKLRGPEYTWRGIRAFPSYLQAGPSFYIEKSKRRMIAEDIAAALALLD